MRILFLFSDMLRAERIHTFNPGAKRGLMDEWLERFGGTAFTNCFTPGPDTPRSMASIFSGRDPKNNGCVQRNMWSQFFLKDDLHIFKKLTDENFQIVARGRRGVKENGLFPAGVPEQDNFEFHDTLPPALKSYRKKAKRHDDMFLFIDLPDYHNAADDFYGASLVHSLASRKLISAYEMIFDAVDKDEFDYIFFFSDHGLKLNLRERFFMDPLMSITDMRSKITMVVRKKGQDTLEKDDRLCSTVDMLPTVLEILGRKIPKKLDGSSLLGKPAKDRRIVIEDYQYLQPGMRPMHDMWAVRNRKHFYLRTYGRCRLLRVEGQGYKEIECKRSFREKYDKMLLEDSATFAECMENYKLQQYYLKNCKKPRFIYSDGSKRMPKWWGFLVGLVYANVGLFAHFWRAWQRRKGKL